MAGGVGNLTVSVGLDAAEFTQGINKLQAQMNAFGKSLSGQVAAGTVLGNVLTELGTQIANLPGRFVDMVKGAIDAADHLNDLSKKTGIAVETIGGIGFAAQQAGGSLESATAGIDKLNKSIAAGAAGNKEALEGFNALGISAKDLKNADPSVVLGKIADAFQGAADGPEKAAIAVRLFGKAGADMIPLLNEGSAALQANVEFFKQYSGVTAEVAAQADQFNDTVAKLSLINRSFGTQLAASLLPTLNQLAEAYLDIKKNGTLMSDAASGIGDVFNALVGVIATAGTVVVSFGKGVGALAAAFIAFQNADFKAVGRIFDEYVADVDAADAANNKFQAGLKKTAQAADPSNYGNEGRNRPAPPKPRLRAIGGGGGGTKDDPAKAQLDDFLKSIDNSIARERDLLQTRNRFLDLYNQQGLVSIADYYGGQAAAQQDALQKEVAGYDRQIAALRDFQNRKGTTQKQSAETEKRITEISGKRDLAEQKAGEASIERGIRQQQAQEELAKAFAATRASVDELAGALGQAAAVRFDQQYDGLKKTFTVEGNQAGLTAIATLRAAAIAQADFQKATLDTGRTLDSLARQEDLLGVAQQTGATTSLEALVKLGDIRRAQIPLLEAQVAAEEAIARASGQSNLIANAEAARVALEKLKATADPLAEKLNSIFESAAESAFFDFISGSKTAAQAFKSFANSVIADLQKIASQQIAQALFGGSTGGAGGFLSALFRGLSGGSGSVGATGGTPGTYSGSAGAGGFDFNLKGSGPRAKSFGDSGVFGAAKETVVNVTPPDGHEVVQTRRSDGSKEVIDLVVKESIRGAARNVRRGGELATAMASSFGGRRVNPRTG